MRLHQGKQLYARTVEVLLTILLVTSANANGTLDQEFDPIPSNLYSFFGATTDKAQTFTVGISGQIVQVDICVSRHPGNVMPLEMDLRLVVNGIPVESDSNTLASVVLNANEVPVTEGFVSVEVSSFSVIVEPGDELAIVLRSRAVHDYTWYGRFGNPYPRGRGHYRNHAPGDHWTLMNADDQGFRTYVSEPVAVEATTWGNIKGVFSRVGR
jgi:hypothetical protein